MNESDEDYFELKYLEEISELFEEFKWIDNYHSVNIFQDDYCDFLDFIKNKVVIYEFSDEEDNDEDDQENNL